MPSPRVISQPTTKFRISPGNQPHRNRSPHHNHGTAEDSFTQKTRFGHRSGWSPCAHSIGKFFLWLIVFFFETSAPGLPGSTCIFLSSETPQDSCVNLLLLLSSLCVVVVVDSSEDNPLSTFFYPFRWSETLSRKEIANTLWTLAKVRIVHIPFMDATARLV